MHVLPLKFQQITNINRITVNVTFIFDTLFLGTANVQHCRRLVKTYKVFKPYRSVHFLNLINQVAGLIPNVSVKIRRKCRSDKIIPCRSSKVATGIYKSSGTPCYYFL